MWKYCQRKTTGLTNAEKAIYKRTRSLIQQNHNERSKSSSPPFTCSILTKAEIFSFAIQLSRPNRVCNRKHCRGNDRSCDRDQKAGIKQNPLKGCTQENQFQKYFSYEVIFPQFLVSKTVPGLFLLMAFFLSFFFKKRNICIRQEPFKTLSSCDSQSPHYWGREDLNEEEEAGAAQQQLDRSWALPPEPQHPWQGPTAFAPIATAQTLRSQTTHAWVVDNQISPSSGGTETP